MSVVAIVNPISGAGANPLAAAERAALLRAEAEKRGLNLEIHFTSRGGHARELAASAVRDGATLVIVWGGDGTLNEAGSSLVGTGAVLGLVPAGSGNGLAAALDVPRDPHAALAAAFDGSPRAIDVGVMAGRPFFNIAGVGFDARIAKLFNERTVGRRGGWRYVIIGVREGCRYRGVDYDLELEGNRQHVRALLISFANGREYGIGARIAPDARLDDGVLDVTIVEDRPILTRFWHARHLALGTPHLAPSVRAQRASHAVVEASGPIEFHVDGEIGVAEDRIEVQLLPRALRVNVARM